MKNKINIFWDKCGFPMTDLLRVTLVSVKGSWGIRISLNTMRSTQVFSEVLYEDSCFILKEYLNKIAKNEFRQK